MNTLDLGLLILRIVVGLTFAAHGAQKAFGWWGGPGPAGWRGALGGMGYQPPTVWAGVSTAIELVGGLLLALGFATPLAAAALLAQAIAIIGLAHWPKGFFNMQGGWEFPMSLLAGAAALLLTGPGAYSVDEALRLSLPDDARLLLLVVAVLGGLAALAIPERGRRATTNSDRS